VPILLLKLTLTPLLIGGASLAARRWGPSIGGWIVSLPLTSAPVILFLAFDHDPAFAANAAVGVLTGLGILGGWSLGYVAVSPRGPFPAVVAAGAVFGALGICVQPILGAPFALLASLALVTIGVSIRMLPPGGSVRSEAPHPAWDLPARMIVGTAIVVTLTSMAQVLGPQLSGLLATYPVYVSVLSVFIQLREGPGGAVDVIRGLLTGLFGTIVFYVVLDPLLTTAGVVPAFGAAVAVTLVVQALALRSVRAGTAEST
jgi:hypothetical protein